VVFFDEIDAVIGARGAGGGDGVGDRVLAQFLAEMDGVEELNGVLVLGATNRLDLLDPAMLRPGRFDEVIELEAPDDAARAEILSVHMRGRPFSEGIEAAELSRLCPGASGAQIAGAVRRASMAAVRRAVRAQESGRAMAIEIGVEDLRRALEVETGLRKEEAA
jgi:transitional endoplasmic reticulum ATPase